MQTNRSRTRLECSMYVQWLMLATRLFSFLTVHVHPNSWHPSSIDSNVLYFVYYTTSIGLLHCTFTFNIQSGDTRNDWFYIRKVQTHILLAGNVFCYTDFPYWGVPAKNVDSKKVPYLKTILGLYITPKVGLYYLLRINQFKLAFSWNV